MSIQAIKLFTTYQKAFASASKPPVDSVWASGIGRLWGVNFGKSPIGVLLFSLLLLTCAFSRWAPAFGATLQLEMHDNLLSLKAADADISHILERLSQAAGIVVRFPKALQKKITLRLSDVRLETALKRILKGLNYATLYSVPAGGDMARVSTVYIYGKQEGAVRSRQFMLRERRIQNRISNYEKRIKSVQQRMDRVPQGSPAAQRYQRQIRNYQRIIERLQRQR